MFAVAFLAITTIAAIPGKDLRETSVYSEPHFLTVPGVSRSGAFFVQFQDRGPAHRAYAVLRDSLERKPEVHFLASVLRGDAVPVLHTHPPHNGLGTGHVSKPPSFLPDPGSNIDLQYICGDYFRVRNANPDTVEVRWEVQDSWEEGYLIVPPPDSTTTHGETFFRAVHQSTVRIFLGEELVQSVPHGDAPACELPPGVWPQIGGALQLFPILDFSLVINDSNGGGRLRMLRTVASIRFIPAMSDSAKQAFFVRHTLTVLAASRSGAYFVQFEDPGPVYRDFLSIIDSLHAAPEVLLAVPIIIDGLVDILHTTDNMPQWQLDCRSGVLWPVPCPI